MPEQKKALWLPITLFKYGSEDPDQQCPLPRKDQRDAEQESFLSGLMAETVHPDEAADAAAREDDEE